MAEAVERPKAALADRYRIERELGAGGMATVYLAQDLKHHRQVAIKVLRPDLAASLGPERFLAEIRTTANLQHPHIVPLFDSGEAAGLVYYVMPYVAGESLRSRLERDHRLDVPTTVAIALGVAQALAAAHAAGVVHRDIKPENILLSHDQPLVTDFGIARAVDAAGGERLTATGVAIGTPAYMSPEQALGEGTVDARSDVYSLGCVIYEMLGGSPPFSGGTVQALLAKRLVGPPPPLALVPRAVDEVVRRALATAPQDRFATAQALAEALVEAARQPATPDLSIVVLPFANLSPDPHNEYFADGLMEEVIADLSKVRALRVISRNSAIQLKGTTEDTRAIGRRLNVRYVLEGSVRKAGGSLRITAQLIDAETDAHLWAEKYSGTVEDVFDLQERLSRQIVEALKITLTPAEDRRLAERPIQDPQVYEYYQRARQELYRFTPDGLGRARHLLEHALKVGGSPALYALRGTCEVNAVVVAGESEEQGFAQAEKWAKRAFEDDPNSPHGHVLMSLIAYRRGQVEECVEHGERALQLEPANTDARVWLACGLILAGQKDRARAVMQGAVETDPLTPINHMLFGVSDLFGRRPDVGLLGTSRAIEIDPLFCPARAYHCIGLLREGRRSEAGEQFQVLARDHPDDPAAQIASRLWRALCADRPSVLAPLSNEARSAALADESYAYLLAAAAALVGESDQAMAWLEQAVTVRGWFDYVYFTKYDPFLHSLHADPRFQALMAAAKERYDRFDA